LPDGFRRNLERKLQSGEITFGLREAVIVAAAAITIACVVVYYSIT
jgi:hypothetical protein